MKALTRKDLVEAIKESGVITKDNIGDILKDFGVVTNKDLIKLASKKDLSKMKKELIESISGVAVSSPTLDMFTKLENRVSSIEYAI